jgi:hypothetical protein
LDVAPAAGTLTVEEVEPNPRNVPIVGVVNNCGNVKYGVLETVGKPLPPNIVELVKPVGIDRPAGSDVGTVYANI